MSDVVNEPTGGNPTTSVQPATNTQQNKKQQNKKQQNKKQKGPTVKSKEHEKIFNAAKDIVIDEDDEWNVDVSEEAMLERRKMALGGMLGNLAANSTSEYELNQTIRNILRSSQSAEEKIKQIKEIQDKENFGVERVCAIIFNASFDKHIAKQLGQQLSQCKPVLEAFSSSAVAQKTILGSLERFIIRNKLVSSFKDILFGFYDCDLLDEEYICDWYSVPTTEYSSLEELELLRKEAFPLIEWLQSADSESESDSE